MPPQYDEFIAPVRRGNKGLGIVVNGQNILVELLEGGQAEEDGYLQVGDLIGARLISHAGS